MTADMDDTAKADVEAIEQSDVLLEEVLVEEVSIDGMCGVY